MTRAEQLEKVKQSLNITGNALDGTLSIFLDDVKYYMADAGVSATVLDSDKAVGCICRGVADLYINNEFSQYFYQRVTQLAIQSDVPEPSVSDTKVTDVVFNIDGAGLIKSGYVSMSDGTKVDADLESIPTLTVTGTDVHLSSYPYTELTITPPLTEGNYYITCNQGKVIPAYGDDMSNAGGWKEWDGVSPVSVNNSVMEVVECDANNLAVRAGKCTLKLDFN